jgi:hypothetical protein
MANNIHWQNPYANRAGRWLRGNLHTHSTGSDGRLTPAQVAEAYAQVGYDFLAISDHMVYTSPPLAPLTLLPGMEWNAPNGGEHTGIYGQHVADTPSAFSAVTSLKELLLTCDGEEDLTILSSKLAVSPALSSRGTAAGGRV